MKRSRPAYALAVLAGSAAASMAFLPSDRAHFDERGRVVIEAPGALELGPDGALFVADSRAATVYALDMGRAASARVGAPLEVTNLEGRIAALLGTAPADVLIRDMVARPGSGTVILSVARGRGPDATGAIVTVSADGEVGLLDLSDVRYSRYEVEKAPAADQPFRHAAWGSVRRRAFTVTDIAFHDGELFITGVTNEEFASSFRRVPFPFRANAAITKVGVYHTEHGEYETEAPIQAFLPVTLNAVKTIVVGYACTPIATFPLSAVTAGATVRGSTIIELGAGTSPRDMLTLERDGAEHLLIVTGRGVYRTKLGDLADAPSLTTPVTGQSGVSASLSLGTVREIERLSDGNYIVLQQETGNALSLRTVPASAL